MNITRRLFLLMTIVAAIAPLSSTIARAAEKSDGKGDSKTDPKNDARKAELQERFKQRFPQIREAKKAGTIGETSDGYLDFVEKSKADKDVRKLVDEENADRKELYTLIAKESGAPVDTVAQRAAKRNFERAHSGDYLKGEDGKWTKKP